MLKRIRFQRSLAIRFATNFFGYRQEQYCQALLRRSLQRLIFVVAFFLLVIFAALIIYPATVSRAGDLTSLVQRLFRAFPLQKEKTLRSLLLQL